MARIDRTTDISNKLIQMGQSLIEEGIETKNYSIIQAGSIMLITAASMREEDDIYQLGELAGMFAAKKIVTTLPGFNEINLIDDLLKLNKKPPKSENDMDI